MVDRTRKRINRQRHRKITAVYHAWRGEDGAGDYEDVLASAWAQPSKKSASMVVLTPAGMLMAAAEEDDAVRSSGLRRSKKAG